MKRSLLNSSDAVLVVIDVQEAFRIAIGEFSPTVSKICTAIKGARLLDVPIVVTEQYPKGLGPTVEEIVLVLPDDIDRQEKTSFGIFGDDGIANHLKSLDRKQIIVTGLETHVCVSQSCHQLLEAGFDVFLLEDAVTSRFDSDKKTALDRLRSAGVIITSVEAMLFEGMRDSRHQNFKEIQGLVK
jgi:nicotinamidase-related amidase